METERGRTNLEGFVCSHMEEVHPEFGMHGGHLVDHVLDEGPGLLERETDDLEERRFENREEEVPEDSGDPPAGGRICPI